MKFTLNQIKEFKVKMSDEDGCDYVIEFPEFVRLIEKYKKDTKIKDDEVGNENSTNIK